MRVSLFLIPALALLLPLAGCSCGGQPSETKEEPLTSSTEDEDYEVLPEGDWEEDEDESEESEED